MVQEQTVAMAPDQRAELVVPEGGQAGSNPSRRIDLAVDVRLVDRPAMRSAAPSSGAPPPRAAATAADWSRTARRTQPSAQHRDDRRRLVPAPASVVGSPNEPIDKAPIAARRESAPARSPRPSGRTSAARSRRLSQSPSARRGRPSCRSSGAASVPVALGPGRATGEPRAAPSRSSRPPSGSGGPRGPRR